MSPSISLLKAAMHECGGAGVKIDPFRQSKVVSTCRNVKGKRRMAEVVSYPSWRHGPVAIQQKKEETAICRARGFGKCKRRPNVATRTYPGTRAKVIEMLIAGILCLWNISSLVHHLEQLPSQRTQSMSDLSHDKRVLTHQPFRGR